MNPLPEWMALLGLDDPWAYAALLIGASLFSIWRLEAMMKHGLEGTTLGTLIMPYCSGLGNILFVIIATRHAVAPREIVINCLVNNLTNLTLLLGLPALLWGLSLAPAAAAGRKLSGKRMAAAKVETAVNRLSLLLTVTAAVFFTGTVWALSLDGRLDRGDGIVLTAVFFFWQSFHVYDLRKHSLVKKRPISPLILFDALLLLASAWALLTSIEWLVDWLSRIPSGPISAGNMGWISGCLMVMPNAILAFYYSARGRADVTYASQVGDGHICIPLCLGLAALLRPVDVPASFETGFMLIGGACLFHLASLALFNGLPRLFGLPLLGAYGWFVFTGVLS